MYRGCLAFIGVFIAIIIAMGIAGMIMFPEEFTTRDIIVSACVLGALGFLVINLFLKAIEYHKKMKEYKKQREK
ncbi:MAG: hypothetical protein ACFFCS_12760 [Candidatus Hodarchaeota archaeon]